MLPVPYIVRRTWVVFLIFHSQLICIRGDCGPPPVIEHTQPIAVTSGVPGATVAYKCNRSTGYYEIPNEPRTITCQDDGTWSTVSTFCIRACGVPNRLQYAVPRDSDLAKDIFLPGTIVKYDCRAGYKRVPQSSNSITCLDNYSWSEPSVFCERKSCGNPGDIENGDFEATDGFLFGSRVTYKCNPGYYLLSRRNYRDCLADGWNNAVPQCEAVICEPPDSPVDGAYNPVKEEYTYLDAVTFTCNKGFHIDGESTASCTSDTTWSTATPKCKAVCTFPPELDFAVVEEEFIHQEYFDNGTSVQYKCRPGFVPITGKNNTVTCLSNLKWSQHEQFCTPISCGDPEAIDHGQMQSENFLFGSRVTYTCNPGYSMVSKRNYRECQADGTWSGKPPVCKEPVCDKIWELQEEARKCTSTPDEWIKYLQVQYLYLQIENMKLDIEIKKRQLGAFSETSPILDEITQ